MQHHIKAETHGPLGKPMAVAVQTCVHCGFCLAACPTYHEFGQEMDTPRGRIVLMKQALEGDLPWRAAQPHVDRCLGCLACEPACPSGVPYRDLISAFRARAEPEFHRTPEQKVRRWMASMTLPYPGRFRLALLGAKVGRALRPLVPPAFRPMVDLAPRKIPPAVRLPGLAPAVGNRRARVALLAGCAQRVLDPDINAATVEVLTRQGVEVVIPEGQGCCGGLAWHTGDLTSAQAFARRNLDAFPKDIDALITNAAGCGSAVHEYPLILRGTPDEERAGALRRQAVDVSAFLARLGWREPPRGFGRPMRVAYHDACHLANAQGVRSEPRRLLASVPGIEVVELANPHLCCGSAGTYNLDQPEIAASLGRQKAQAVIGSGADLVASGNIGCLTQFRAHLARLGWTQPIRHTVQVLRDAL